jgi:RimJ/RimL family protein N-acetyltransferase
VNAATITFRPLVVDDLPLLHAWVQRPHVAQWWDTPRTAAEIEAEYRPVAEGRTSTRACIALCEDTPIGFIQSYVVVGAGDGWWGDEKDPGARGIDQFLADAHRLDQGLGTAMIQAFLRRLFADPAVTQVQTDPSPQNARAIRCYEKSGFRAAGIVETPDGPVLLMRCMRP